jgi:hypothetical protein
LELLQYVQLLLLLLLLLLLRLFGTQRSQLLQHLVRPPVLL